MNGKSGLRSLLLLVVILSGILAVLFHNSFVPGQALFSNDGPLGIQFARAFSLPQAYFGIWNDSYWIGSYAGTYLPTMGGLIYGLLGQMGRVNFYGPMCSLVLGMCAWLFFRRVGCNSRVAILAGLAAALNMNFFSNMAWGLGSRQLSLAATFLALAAVETGFTVRPFVTSVLAGFALGHAVNEGGDNGAFFSMFVAAYAFYRTWFADKPSLINAAKGVGKVVLMAVCAAGVAYLIVEAFQRTAVTGVVGTQQDSQTKAQKWDFATQWSLPKIETLRVIIPGLFGYHMTPHAHSPESSYWGTVGQYPSVPELQKQFNSTSDPNARAQLAGYLAQGWRSSGAGEYAGVPVVLIALWATVEALRRKGQIFTPMERKVIWFWAGAAVVAMLLGWGRHAPFYRLLYALPYFSTLRNPMKLFHVFDMCVMILFAYGLMGLNRRYLDVPAKASSLFGQLKAWWAKAPAHEKLWTYGCIAAVAAGLVGWFGYMGSRTALVKHLMETGFNEQELATSMARFSINEVFLFVVTLALSVLILTFILSGAFAGRRATWAAVILGTVLVIDLSRADVPWIKYDKWKEQYAANPVFDILREKPHEHRVAMPGFQLNQQFGMLQSMYHGEWIQRQFPYFGIQSIDIPQEPRLPADKQAYRDALSKNMARLWQLTNTRYVFGLAGIGDMLNQQLDPVQKGFRQRAAFSLIRKSDGPYIGIETNATGPFALFEFTSALPRARLYNNWEIITDEKALLARLGDTNWNPAQSVLLTQDAPKPTAPTAPPGKAEIVSNPSTKLMEIQTTSDTPAMLLLNDKIEPEWHAYIDGQPAPVLRANYLMRAVHVPAGSHKVVFKYEATPTGFIIVLACDVLGLGLVVVVARSARQKRSTNNPNKPLRARI